MSRIVFDIETLGYPFDSFDEDQQQYLMKFAKSEDERDEVLQKLNLYPTTAQIIAIGMLNPDSGKGMVLFQADEELDYLSDDGNIQFISGSEAEIITRFWNLIAPYSQCVTFNGRGFDGPFLLMRSALLQIKPSKNLLPYRYSPQMHCDLLDQFTFYGAMRKFSLDFYCKAFGIESPKSHGITGLDLGTLFEQKKFGEIAEYCLGDVRATATLFQRWEQYLRFEN